MVWFIIAIILLLIGVGLIPSSSPPAATARASALSPSSWRVC